VDVPHSWPIHHHPNATQGHDLRLWSSSVASLGIERIQSFHLRQLLWISRKPRFSYSVRFSATWTGAVGIELVGHVFQGEHPARHEPSRRLVYPAGDLPPVFDLGRYCAVGSSFGCGRRRCVTWHHLHHSRSHVFFRWQITRQTKALCAKTCRQSQAGSTPFRQINFFFDFFTFFYIFNFFFFKFF